MLTKPMVFINLPVKDLARAKEFFSGLGFSFNPQFTDGKAACMVINDGASYAMLITEEFYKTFVADRGIANARAQSEVLVALSAASRAEVDDMVAKAVSLGGRDYRREEHGDFMYGRAFEDLDGHIWELTYMDMSKVPPTPAPAQ